MQASSEPEPSARAMSLSITAGANALLQVGVSLSDIALIIRKGRTFGNWLRVKSNDQELFEAILEDPEALLKRKGIVEPSKMESRFSSTEFIYQSGKVSTSSQPTKPAEQTQDSELPRSKSSALSSDTPGLRPFSWLMIIIITALDICVAHDRIIEFIVELLALVLENAETENSLRVSLGVNIESWRSAGQVRRMAPHILRTYRSVWKKYGKGEAIPQLNASEDYEAHRFLKWLLENETNSFTCYSVSTLAIAKTIQACGVSISVDGERSYEAQLLVTYVKDGTIPLGPAGDRRLPHQAEMISYPARQPKSMIQAVDTSRSTRNEMELYWELGTKAASGLTLVASSTLPYTDLNESVCYELAGNKDQYPGRFSPEILMLSSKAFPCKNQEILDAIASLLETVRQPSEKEWLETHAGLEYLLRGNAEDPKSTKVQSLWLQYQALVFGFYYSLLAPMVCFDFLSTKEPYLRGVWGRGGTTFLAMCTQFGNELQREGKVSRTHVVYMLAAMYGGRPKVHNLRSSRHNLIGVLGTTSVLALHLLRASDQPQELARFAVLDLPVVHLVPEDDGDLYASSSFSIRFRPPSPVAREIQQRRTTVKKWSIHSSMASVFAGGVPGVVMGARCDGRLAGWFSPAAADTLFLSSAYLRKEEGGGQDPSDECIKGFEVLEEDFQKGVVPSPATAENDVTAFGVVHSARSPVFRYAAAGFYGGAGDEVVIANGNMMEAFGRIEMQGSGIIIC
ncbi:hypothetical protein PG993_011647 [Apiospora rasikravindrae]|uniref:Uncharacterized protein n=1 Tax=Apiospora rasikravindrae TaxID=990691 RepID=A0ABR1S078_9PEZI